MLRTFSDFWQGFEKEAIRGGGTGFDAQGEGSISGSLEYDDVEGTQKSHGSRLEDTRTNKELLDRDRNPRDFGVNGLGPILESDSVPIKY